jgi:2-amino-4-hydroxy-6-hydroxymethyldihydropteridine diphosphokinase
MIIIGIGANLKSVLYNSIIEACEKSLQLIKESNIDVICQSSWYETEPIPASSQSNFINGVICVKTQLSNLDLLKVLLSIETKMGRRRSEKNAERIIDLDLIAYHDDIIESELLTLPHPRLYQRAFVVRPIFEIAPDWRHPVLGVTVGALLPALADQKIKQLKS